LGNQRFSMIRFIAFTLILLFKTVLFSEAQNPLIKMWDKNYGGLEDDEPTCFLQTFDGGFIIGGYTYSGIGGDKTESLKNGSGVYDYWVVKTDASGNKVWDKDFGGGNGDQLYTIVQTPDSGYLLGGISASVISGDKTQPSYGNYDFWILKIDASGIIQWDKDFGGTGSDQLDVIVPANDGGFLFCGSSASGISGDKTQANQGLLDYWILKTDAQGNKLWDKTFGGIEFDKLYSAVQTSDGGFLLGGSSRSAAGADKTGDVWGLEDYWIIKIDSLGNKLWDSDFGGTESDILYSLVEDKRGHIIAGGRSGSDISGNKTQPLWGGYDYWILDIDSAGNIISDKSIGGTSNEDEFGNVSLTKDGGYVFAGTSYSQISGNKSENNLGQEQSWFLKYDSTFSKQWDKTVFTPCHDETGLVMQTRDQCYIIVNSNGPNCGAGGDRSFTSWNNSRDFWIVKYCDTTLFPPVASASPVAGICPGTCTSFLNLSIRSTACQWSFPGATPDTSSAFNPSIICYGAPGSYDVKLIAYNPNGTDTILLQNFVTVYDLPAPQGILQQDDSLISNSGYATYQWYFNGTAINGATEYLFVATYSGNFSVVSSDTNGCEVEAVINNVLAGQQYINVDRKIELYPNPVKDELGIRSSMFGEKAVDISIYNVTGEKIYSLERAQDIHSPDFKINCDFLSPGLYFIELSGSDQVYRSTFMKK
jgi:hypothetical protein